MKKITIALLAGLMLAGCSSGKASKEDYEKLDYGQSKSEVEKLLGKPKSQTTDKDEIVDNITDYINGIDEMTAIMSHEALEDKRDGLQEVKDRITSGKEATVAEYVYEVDDSERPIYFVNGNLWYYSYFIDD